MRPYILYIPINLSMHDTFENICVYIYIPIMPLYMYIHPHIYTHIIHVNFSTHVNLFFFLAEEYLRLYKDKNLRYLHTREGGEEKE
jgi:hypothetical protein